MNKDLTQGKPEKVLWNFCLPLFGSIIFQQLYNIADSLIAGKFVGENALAAVGNSYEITLIFIAFAFGCNIGCSVIVSGYFGAKEYHHARTAVHTTLISGGILCAFLMLVGFAGCSGLLELIHTPEEIMADSRLYLMIYIAGLPFLFFYNIATGIFSALGDSRTPFFFLSCSSTANIVMDYVFVKYLQMGVSGVAWATFICQGISCVLAMIVVFRHLKALKAEKKAEVFSTHIFKQICVVAVPSILQQSFISIGNIVIQSLINGFGPAVIAGYAAAIKLNNLVITSFTTLGNGISNYTAQNLGAGKYDRIHSGFKAGLKLVWILCIPIILIYITFGKGLVFLFMDNAEGPAINTGILILRILAPFYLVVSAKLVADGVLRGASLMKQFMTATFTDLILRVLLADLLSRLLGATGIWSAWPIGWLIGTAVSLFFYNRQVKRKSLNRTT
ncbi:MAG: MATE family efflux transporter [Lachnospiraceae bacterium]|nr:MATE family efflux transporter [Lachnospiraceae bacterium]MDE6184231.1 MATE family efflux transporter [Lachnospiraceae bacterium]